MNPHDLESLARKLREQRASLVRELGVAEAGLESMAESRESEIEERAQEERVTRLLSRLDLRAKKEVEDVDAALGRIAAGTFGTCARCGGKIPAARLQALPAALHCLACARAEESPAGEEPEEETDRRGPVPAELALLGDRDKERAVWRTVLDDGRVDCDELRLVCRRGVVYLGGAVPSEPEHRMLLRLVTEVAGFTEVVDHLRVNPMLWGRDGDESGSARPSASSEAEDPENEDVVLSIEEGIEWAAPGEPPPDEE